MRRLFTQPRRETVRKVPEVSTTQPYRLSKQLFSDHFGLRIPAKATLRASIAPFSDSLRSGILGSSLHTPGPPWATMYPLRKEPEQGNRASAPCIHTNLCSGYMQKAVTRALVRTTPFLIGPSLAHNVDNDFDKTFCRVL
jgi:hypothetical protein